MSVPNKGGGRVRRKVLVTCAAAACLAAVVLVARAATDTQRNRLSAQGDSTEIVQTYSPKCQTDAGICTVSPLPVGSSCLCGSQSGIIVP